MLTGQTAFIVAIALLCNALGSVSFKLGAAGRHADPHSGAVKGMLAFAVEMLGNRQILLGLLLQAIALVCWLAFLSRVALSFAFPLSSASNITVLLASHFILREHISSRRWAGVMLILGGIALIASA